MSELIILVLTFSVVVDENMTQGNKNYFGSNVFGFNNALLYFFYKSHWQMGRKEK